MDDTKRLVRRIRRLAAEAHIAAASPQCGAHRAHYAHIEKQWEELARELEAPAFPQAQVDKLRTLLRALEPLEVE